MPNAVGVVLDQLDRLGERPAIVEPSGRSMTYSALGNSVRSLRTALRAEGVASGDRVLLQTRNGADFCGAALAVLAEGAIPLLVETSLGDAVYLDRVAHAAPKLCIHSRIVRALQSPLPGAAFIGNRARRWLRGRELHVPPPAALRSLSIERMRRQPPCSDDVIDCAGSDTALVVYTGGTTSKPKGVCIPHKAVPHYLGAIRSVADWSNVETILADQPQQTLYALFLGKTVMITKGQHEVRAGCVRQALMNGRAQAYFGSPTTWDAAIGIDASPFPDTLQLALLGSAPVGRAFLRRLLPRLPGHTQVLSLYGMTEVGPICWVDAREKLTSPGDGDLVGAPLPSVTLKVQEDGELLVQSPSRYSHYLGEGPAGDDWLHTGDLAELADGKVTLLGRKKDMILRRGVNIYPSALEGHLLDLQADGRPLLTGVAMVGVWHEEAGDESICLVYVSEFARARVRQHVEAGLERDLWPDQYIEIDRLPVKGRQNKVDKEALRTLARGRASAAAAPKKKAPFEYEAHRRAVSHIKSTTGASSAARYDLTRRIHHGLVQLSFGIDNLAFPHWASSYPAFRGPLFIIGHQRSGTTAVHRSLASADGAFGMSLEDMLLPGLAAKRLRDLPGPLLPFVRGKFKSRTAPLSSIHAIDLESIEEDEFAFLATQQTGMAVNGNEALLASSAFDDLRNRSDWAPEKRAAAIEWYAACIQKAALSTGVEHPWCVAKNPAFTAECTPLSRDFPSARFLFLYRDPDQAIPSRLRLIQEIYRLKLGQPDFLLNEAQIAVIERDSLRTYRRGLDSFALLPKHRRYLLRFDDLQTRADEAMREALQHLDIPLKLAPFPPRPSSSPSAHEVTKPPARDGYGDRLGESFLRQAETLGARS